MHVVHVRIRHTLTHSHTCLVITTFIPLSHYLFLFSKNLFQSPTNKYQEYEDRCSSFMLRPFPLCPGVRVFPISAPLYSAAFSTLISPAYSFSIFCFFKSLVSLSRLRAHSEDYCSFSSLIYHPAFNLFIHLVHSLFASFK